MQNKILLYLSIFAVLFTIFIYVNDKKILDAKEDKIEKLQIQVGELQAKNELLESENLSLNYFSLAQNEEAISYFENQGIDSKKLITSIEDQIISQNRAEEDNALIPFEGMNGVMRINKIKILNHKWIIADFTDGTYWGELFLSYEVDKENNLNLTTEKSFLYPAN
jgi:hypothetical protein